MSFFLLCYATWNSYNKPITPLLEWLGVLRVFVFENIFVSKKFSIGNLRSQDEERYEGNFFKNRQADWKSHVTWIF